MKFLLSFAWRNLRRYRRRTAITASAIALGLAVYIFMDAWIYGMTLDSQRNLILYETGSVRVQRTDYWKDRKHLPLQLAMEDWPEVLGRLRGAGIEATARTVFAAELVVDETETRPGGALRVKATAIDATDDGRVFRLDEVIRRGSRLTLGQAGALVGSRLAEDLGLAPGAPLTLRTRTRFGAHQTVDLVISGILDSPNPEVNRGNVFVDAALADELLDMGGARTEIDCSFPTTSDPSFAQGRVAAALASVDDSRPVALVAKAWSEIAREAVMASRGDYAQTYVLLFLLVIIAGVGVSNTMLTAVFERTREIGMMRALGMTDRKITLSFMLEGAGIGAVGALIGLALGSVLTFWVVEWGIDFADVFKDSNVGYRISGIYRGAWHPAAMAASSAAGVVFSALIAAPPVRRALKSEIVDCLRST